MTAGPQQCESEVPASGVLVIGGYGIRVAVERRHLVINDGSGRTRRQLRIPKVRHGIRRLVVLGHSGFISLEAIRWLDGVGIALLHIDTDGRILASTASLGRDDPRLRRAQARAAGEPYGLEVTQALLDAKLAGQAAVAENQLHDTTVAERIQTLRNDMTAAQCLAEARDVEAVAAQAYWAAWPERVALRWANHDRSKIPDHWTRFESRRSPLSTGSARQAADPLNAILNYLYRLAESECRLACLALGLDPGIGILHADAVSRDSLALDLIEVVRPAVEAWTIDLADAHIFRHADFAERDNGGCRVLQPLTHHLANTLPRWEAEVAPWAENVAHRMADASPYTIAKKTPLTSTVRRERATQRSESRRRGASESQPERQRALSPVVLHRGCVDCGVPLQVRQRTYCPDCWPARRDENRLQGSAASKAALTNAQGRSARGEAIRRGKRHARARKAQELGHQPDEWLDLAPQVAALSLKAIMAATGLSVSQASRIKSGKAAAAPDHWANLKRLVQ